MCLIGEWEGSDESGREPVYSLDPPSSNVKVQLIKRENGVIGMMECKSAVQKGGKGAEWPQ